MDIQNPMPTELFFAVYSSWCRLPIALGFPSVTSTCFVPAYAYLLKDERCFRRSDVDAED